MIKVTLLYGHPSDPAAFERYYNETHVPHYGAKIPGLKRADLAKVVGTPDGSRPAYYRTADLWFEDQRAMQAAFESDEGKAGVADLGRFATGGVTIVISEADVLTETQIGQMAAGVSTPLGIRSR